MSETAIVHPDGIPKEAADLWQQLLAQELVDWGTLRRQVQQYRDRIEEKAKEREFLDLPTATAITDVLLRLLDSADETTPDDDRQLIQAAVSYFITEHDAEGDFESITGFDDDAEVVNAVLRQLGHQGWLIELG